MKIGDCESASKFEIECEWTEWKFICEFKFEISKSDPLSYALIHQN